MISLRNAYRFKPVIGTILCSALAVAVAIVGQHKPEKSILPIWFLAVIMLIVVCFGSLAGILGSLFSAIIFAVYLFEPFGRLAVQDSTQKSNLMWMVLIGLMLSLFGRPPGKLPVSKKS